MEVLGGDIQMRIFSFLRAYYYVGPVEELRSELEGIHLLEEEEDFISFATQNTRV